MVLLQSQDKLKLGSIAPEFKLKATDGKKYSLESFKNAKAYLIIFMCNHCPYVKPQLEEINNIATKYKDKDLVVIGINSNESENYTEDSYENMVKLMNDNDYSFYYLHDTKQTVVDLYEAVCTPDPFLFDKNKKLVYHGRLNNAINPDDTITKHEMDEIINKLLDGQEIDEEFKPSQGCSIKKKMCPI
jgi:peroxiredoxin